MGTHLLDIVFNHGFAPGDRLLHPNGDTLTVLDTRSGAEAQGESGTHYLLLNDLDYERL